MGHGLSDTTLKYTLKGKLLNGFIVDRRAKGHGTGKLIFDYEKERKNSPDEINVKKV